MFWYKFWRVKFRVVTPSSQPFYASSSSSSHCRWFAQLGSIPATLAWPSPGTWLLLCYSIWRTFAYSYYQQIIPRSSAWSCCLFVKLPHVMSLRWWFSWCVALMMLMQRLQTQFSVELVVVSVNSFVGNCAHDVDDELCITVHNIKCKQG